MPSLLPQAALSVMSAIDPIIARLTAIDSPFMPAGATARPPAVGATHRVVVIVGPSRAAARDALDYGAVYAQVAENNASTVPTGAFIVYVMKNAREGRFITLPVKLEVGISSTLAK